MKSSVNTNAGSTGDQSAAPQRRRGTFRLGLWLLAGILLLIAATGLLIAIAAHQQVSIGDLQRWEGWASSVRRYGLLAQCIVVASAGLFWRQLVAAGYRSGIVKRRELKAVLRMRTKAIAWGVLYLVLVPIGPLTIWRFFFA